MYLKQIEVVMQVPRYGSVLDGFAVHAGSVGRV